MMNTELSIVAAQVQQANTPVQIFGSLLGNTVEEKLNALKLVYRPLVRVAFPERYQSGTDDYRLAETVFKKLSQLKAEADQQIKNQCYGIQPAASSLTIQFAGKTYELQEQIASGDVADLYRTTDGLLKIAKHPDDNDLLLNEQAALDHIRTFLSGRERGKIWLQTIPEIQRSFVIKSGAEKIRVNQMPEYAGFLNLADIQKKAGPIDARTLGWMWKRVINLLDWVHHAGYVHGAVLPPHLLFFPDNANRNTRDVRKHAAHLIDFCYAAAKGDPLRAWCPDWIAFYPPSVLNKQPIAETVDFFMAAKCMVYATGGDVAKGVFPRSIPRSLADHISECFRLSTAWSYPAYFAKFVRLLEQEFGAPKWHDFLVPGIKETT